MNSDTPLTDAAKIPVCLNWDNQGDHVRYVVPVGECKKLERRLATLRAAAGRVVEADRNAPIGTVMSKHFESTIADLSAALGDEGGTST